MYESEQTAELATALAKAQGAMRSAVLNKINPHFRSRYADLAAVLDAVRMPLADQGLSITQTTQAFPEEGFALLLVTTLRHTSGQWIKCEYPLPWPAKPQELGSALTYARRYSISALVCIAADEDDDANAANAASRPREEPLNEEQFKEINAQLIAAKAKPEDFLVWVRLTHSYVKTLNDIPVSFFDTAIAKIQEFAIRKREQLAAKKGAQDNVQ